MRKAALSFATLEELVTRVEQAVRNRMENEISSTVIGELVMEQLKAVDEVAYVRFASVYRQFKDIDIFMEELENLLNARKKWKEE